MAEKELIPAKRIVLYESVRMGMPSGKHSGHLCEVRKSEEVKEKVGSKEKVRHLYELYDPFTDSTFKFEHTPPRHKLSVQEGKNGNMPPRTLPALRGVVLMNYLRHRPKSVTIQTDTEVVIQVRGDYERLVKKLKKLFKSKGVGEVEGVMSSHVWKLRALGVMTLLQNERNDYMTIRFENDPELGVRRKKETETEVATSAAVAQAVIDKMSKPPRTTKVVDPTEVGDDLESIVM